MNTATITSWLLTYLIHSTALLGAAWLVSRFLGERRLALQETVLRTALIGGLLTATLQIGLGVEPIGGALAIDGLSHSEIVVTDVATTPAPARIITTEPPSTTSKRSKNLWPGAILCMWGIGSLMALLVLGRSVLDLKRLLKTRRFRPAGRIVDRLATSMGLRRTVRLSTSAAITVPFATGIRRPEICCPERVRDLAIEHQTGLFAHELAHLARRDPAWQLLYRLGEAILFLQPLNRLVSRRLEDIAEHLTDERAVACTGDRLGLARCLVVVAHWGVAGSPGVPATAFASGPRLDRRVRHLISGAIGQCSYAPWMAPLLAVVLIASVLLLPVIMPSTAHADVSPTGSDAVPLDAWSMAAITSGEEEEPPPAPPEAPAVPYVPRSAVPVANTAPAADTAPRSPAAPAPAASPDTGALPSPATAPGFSEDTTPPKAPEPGSEPTPPTSPTAPEPPEQTDTKPAHPAPEASSDERQRERAKEEARARHRESHRQRSQVEARVREQERVLYEERRALAERARELALEAMERGRLTDAEREKLRNEARELQKHTQAGNRKHPRAAAEQSRVHAERSRELAREVAERLRLTDEKRDEMRRRAEDLHAEARELAREASREAREHARELSQEARRLAKEADAERLAEEDQKRLEKVE